MVLFDALDSLDSFDTVKLKKVLNKERKDLHLPTAQSYLQKMILKAMRAYTSESTPSGQVNEMLNDIRFLENKGHFAQADKLAEKALKIARSREMLPYCLELLRTRQRMLSILHPRGLRSKMQELVEEKKQAMADLNTEQILANLYSVVFVMRRELGQPEAGMSKDMILQTIDDGLVGIPVERLTLQGGVLYNMLQTFRADCEGKPELALTHATRISELWVEKPALAEEMPQLYRVSFANYLALAFRCKRWDLFPEAMQRISSLPPSSMRDEAELFQNARLFQLIYLMNTDQLAEAFRLIPEIEKGLVKYDEQVNLSRKLTFYYNFCIISFFTREFKAALRWIPMIQEARGAHTRRDIIDFSGTLLLMIHYELGNNDLLEYMIRNLRRKLPDLQHDTSPEVVITSFVEKAMGVSAKEVSALASQALQLLEGKLKEKNISTRIGVMEIKMWLRGKV